MTRASVRHPLVLSLLLTWALPAAVAQQLLPIPEIVSGSEIDLTVQEGTNEFYPGIQTSTFGANGNILGPTIELHKGQAVVLNVHNQLPEVTTMHWHGLHVAPENDGGPHSMVHPGDTWSPAFTVLDHASTYWYHPHAHHTTEHQVSMGIAGMIIVRDEDEAALALPRTYGVDDIPVIIQTKNLDEDGQIVAYTNSDDVLMVNATIDPFVELPAQVVRLRVLNGSSMRSFNLGFSGNRTFYQIGSDGGLLSQSVPQTRLLLSPGERAEVLLDLGGMQGSTLHLRSFASEIPNGIYGAAQPGIGMGMTLDGYHPNPLNGTDFDILRIDVGAPTADPITSIIQDLVDVTAWDPELVDETRAFSFNPTVPGPNQLNHPVSINGALVDMGVINEVVALDNVEMWEITNATGIAHPFHVHMIQFYVVTRNGVVPPAHEQGRKDVVLVRPLETVRIITKFETFANEDVPYMYHCHMLIHEDDGMMGQFLVLDMTTSSEGSPESSEHLTLQMTAPNPFTSTTTIAFNLLADDRVTVAIYTIAGHRVGTVLDTSLARGRHEVTLDSGGLASGTYVVRLTTGTHQVSRQITLIR